MNKDLEKIIKKINGLYGKGAINKGHTKNLEKRIMPGESGTWYSEGFPPRSFIRKRLWICDECKRKLVFHEGKFVCGGCWVAKSYCMCEEGMNMGDYPKEFAKSEVECPVDSSDVGIHFGKVKTVPGNDNYDAGWSGKGDLIVIPCHCECGHQWEMCLGFHKGTVFTFIRNMKEREQ